VLVLAEPVNPLVRERWARSTKLGLRREADAYPVGTSSDDLHDRKERLDDVLREERELLEPISLSLAGGPLVAIVADRDGVILSTHADRHFVDPMARVRLVEGARWGEETRGTNAIGTALVEGCPVAVVGSAHFELRNRELFCYATPVRDAYGDIVAVLDVTGPLVTHDPAIGLAVQAAGVALERALRGLAYGDARSGALAAIERLVHRSSGPAMLIEASGIARVVNAAAREALALPAEVTLTCERLFGIPFDVLVTTAAGRGGMRFETRTGAWKIAIDPVAGAAHRPLALLVHFEPERFSSRAFPAAPRSAPASPASSEAPELVVILGQDAAVRQAKEKAERFARTSLPVLLLAETGTGKELFARAIHAVSERRARPFVAINCGALSPELIASEMFGYAPGSFTGASRGGAEGRIGAANGGTLFLDEIAEMPPSLQAALLRVLDSGVYQRVGETRDRHADFRLICATCRDLPALVDAGSFRSDLFYRIQGACVTLPALRDRTDTVWLAERLLETLSSSRLAEDAVQYVASHDWPGNVRELKSAMTHAVALAQGEPWIRREHLPLPLPSSRPSRPAGPLTKQRIVRDAIEATLGSCAGNVSEAARRLGVGRGTIYRAVRTARGVKGD
jgi:transcriptional regulator of acetoin/glycerol metabolism